VTMSQTIPSDDFHAVGRYVTDTIRAANPDYAELEPDVLADVIETNVHNARIYLHAVVHQRRPTSDELASLADAARRRVHQGITLEAMLRAYRIGARAMWEKLSESRPDLDPHLITDCTLRYIDWVSSEAERAYLAERDKMLNSRLETTKLLLTRIAEDDFDADIDRDAALAALGLDPAAPHTAVVVAATSRAAGPLDEPVLELLQDIRRMLPQASSALLRRGVVILLPAAANHALESLLTAAFARLGARAKALSAGIGRPAPTGAGLAGSVREAERARTLGEILFPSSQVHSYESMGFYDLFKQGGPVDTFVETVLGEHLGPDRRGKVGLVRTLFVYFTLGMNRKAAATRLGIHPNTLDYRLRQATKASGVELTSAEESFRFQLAVRLLPICTQTSWLDEPSGVSAILAD
jgi:DNA-binding PucR family transcriptional regulator